ncbi:energy transducer TonB [Sphingomonas oryzagri]|uniref:Energy transducer TonB n=1 Tax=Sphingomonas oryzagri TaxID=3042314 RepID=A0ABT6N766_9SPHN|nr:energy transducer TonB [Sphingomonas oryzagri]MDH7640954.1 energy transducer TonB [Sphingomonas oryzagri]
MILLFAAAASAAVPLQLAGYPGDWITPDDYPPLALSKGEWGYYSFALTVAPTGKNEKCEIISPGGFDDLRDLTCALVMKRAKFRPALDVDGHPVFGVFRSSVAWTQGSNMADIQRLRKRFPPPSDSDLDVSVNQLPAGMEKSAKVKLGVQVDEKGAIKACNRDPSEKASALDAVACQQIEAQWKVAAATDKGGAPVSSVQSVTVAFSTGAQPQASAAQ